MGLIKEYKNELQIKTTACNILKLLLSDLPFEPRYFCIEMHQPKSCCGSLNLGWRENTKKYTGGHWVIEDIHNRYLDDITAIKIQNRINSNNLHKIKFRAAYSRYAPDNARDALTDLKSAYLDILTKNNYELKFLEIVHSFQSGGYDGEDYYKLEGVEFRQTSSGLDCKLDLDSAGWLNTEERENTINWFDELTKKISE